MKMKHYHRANRLTALLCIFLMTVLCLPCFLLPVSAENDESAPGPDFPTRTDSPLYRKSVLFCGDSICEASTDDSILSTEGWAGRIGTVHDMDWKNVGLSGASVSTCRGNNRIIRQVKADPGKPYDILILHGGINDAWDVAPVGALTAGDCYDPAAFDPDTFAGAMEELLYSAKAYYPDAVTGYIINYRCYSGEHGVIADMEEYVAVTIAACEKWSIPYLDMYHDDDFCRGVLKADTTEYLFDHVHPNGAGYDLLAPVVEAWMEALLTPAAETETAAPPETAASVTTSPETVPPTCTEPAGSGCASVLTCTALLSLLAGAACLRRKRTE
ncbi:MAG: SGNH/GDSL hydrolase family protein [Clostridia bacterium]|nr:SGNH/GDSL hydrolase family protein [Clostridia bacterium]